MWKELQYAWLSYWLRREYERRLRKVSQERWVNNRHGLMTREREIVHEWYAREVDTLYQKYCK